MKRTFSMRLLLAGSLLSVMIASIQPARAQISLVAPQPIQIHDGKPDLDVRISADPTSIDGHTPPGFQDLSLITISVENRLTVPQGFFRYEGVLHVFGSEAKPVLIHIDLPAPLAQVGNVGV